MWYQKKVVIIPAIIAGLLAVTSLTSNTQATLVPQPVQQTAPATTPELKYIPVSQRGTQSSPSPTQNGLSNSNYYTNVDGNSVHSPAYSNTAPVGASAQCRDGTYSFSQHRSGTCSHHGGVAEWL